MNEQRFFKLMEDKLPECQDFDEFLAVWYPCFGYMLKKLCKGHNRRTIKSLFWDFEMANWEAMHQENTEYANYNKEHLIGAFISECAYIVDRFSYDRLFRAHWLFLRAFDKEVWDKK